MACARRSEGRGKVQMELNIEDYAPEVRTFLLRGLELSGMTHVLTKRVFLSGSSFGRAERFVDTRNTVGILRYLDVDMSIMRHRYNDVNASTYQRKCIEVLM